MQLRLALRTPSFFLSGDVKRSAGGVFVYSDNCSFLVEQQSRTLVVIWLNCAFNTLTAAVTSETHTHTHTHTQKAWNCSRVLLSTAVWCGQDSRNRSEDTFEVLRDNEQTLTCRKTAGIYSKVTFLNANITCMNEMDLTPQEEKQQDLLQLHFLIHECFLYERRLQCL